MCRYTQQCRCYVEFSSSVDEEVVAREDVESLQFLPLPHGPLVNSLVQSVRAPSTSASTDFSNAKKKHHHAESIGK